MKVITVLVALGLSGLLASCSIDPHPMDMNQAVQSARTRADHESLATHYDAAAKEMQAKAEEHQRMLAQYQGNKGLYGKQAQDLINHCQGLVRIYQQAAAENAKMAETHRLAAAEAK